MIQLYTHTHIFFFRFFSIIGASLVAQLVKNPPAMWETWVRSLGWEDPLEKGKATPIPVFWPGEFHGLYIPWDHKELDTTEQHSLSTIGHYKILNIIPCALSSNVVTSLYSSS